MKIKSYHCNIIKSRRRKITREQEEAHENCSRKRNFVVFISFLLLKSANWHVIFTPHTHAIPIPQLHLKGEANWWQNIRAYKMNRFTHEWWREISAEKFRLAEMATTKKLCRDFLFIVLIVKSGCREREKFICQNCSTQKYGNEKCWLKWLLLLIRAF